MKNKRRIYIITVLVVVMTATIAVSLFSVSTVIKSRSVDALSMTYEELCEKNGDMWMEMPPFRNGKAVSANKCIGCMIDDNHFCSLEEYIDHIKQMPNIDQSESPEIQQINSINRSIANLASAEKSQIVGLSDGEMLNLEAKSVAKNIDGNLIRMYGYNGQIPGPLIKVKQGIGIYVNFTNNLDMETTVHWHGIRLKNEFDGVPNVTQEPVKPGESFLYRLDFPDDGIYWYHPHIREDLQQELGLYGNMLVEPIGPYSPTDKELALFLDDIRIANGDVEIFTKDYARFALMGRFGNIMLVNGETDYQFNARKNEIVRLYITNSANARPFNFSIEGHKIKLIGGDSGKYEKEIFIDSIIIGPAERYIVEAYFDKPGSFKLLHTAPKKVYTLGKVNVVDSKLVQKLFQFSELKENNVSGLDSLRNYLSLEPDYEIDLTIEMPMMDGMNESMMGMPMQNEINPIEWEDDMATMNAMMTNEDTRWIMRDKQTGKENMDINYKVKVGDKKKIRIFNDPSSMHPMQHPIHIHGQRFLVLAVDGVPNDNLVWKDTVLAPAGSTVDILVDFTNPGEWMIHCHIAEHIESGMMSMFEVN